MSFHLIVLKENLDEVMVEEEELEQQLHACSQECNETVVELSKLNEQNEKVVDKERLLDEKVSAIISQCFFKFYCCQYICNVNTCDI